MEALRRCDVYELVQRPRGRKVIKNRWVFDVKTDSQKKAHLVAKGFSQVEGLDVRNTYLYGKLDDEIYMEQPEGFRVPNLEDYDIRLKKALYGLKQAGLAWW